MLGGYVLFLRMMIFEETKLGCIAPQPSLQSQGVWSLIKL